MIERLVWGAGLFVLGAILGSFVATLVVRWPHGLSVMRGRSRCDACGATIGVRDLVPLVSAISLGRQCRTCGGGIDPRHWRIELICAGVGAAAGLAAPGPGALAGLVFGILLVALATLDLALFWLPDRLTGALALTGLVAGLIGLGPPLPDRLLGGVLGFGLLWLVGEGYRRLRGREGLGGGDPKLFGAIGLWLGWRMLPAVLLVAGLVGLGVVLFARARGQRLGRSDALPLGTLLAVAAYPAWLIMVAAAR